MTGTRKTLKFPASKDGGGVVVQKKRWREKYNCDHQTVWLDEKRRMVECRKCGQSFECYDWIKHLLRWQLWKFSTLEETRRLIDVAEKKLIELRRDETNIKSRIRSAKAREKSA